MYRGFTDFLPLENIDTTKVIQYTDSTEYSTYTFKINNDDNSSINFENLYLLETEQGYIGYILSYEPEQNWYETHLIYQHGEYILDMNNYVGDITKYSLEREVIWSTKQENENRGMASRGGQFVEVCVISVWQICTCGVADHANDPEGQGCNCIGYASEANCQTVWSGGGGSPGDGGGNDGDGTGGGTGTTCTTSTGTIIIDEQPIAGVNGGCTPNTTLGTIPPDAEVICTPNQYVTDYVYNCLGITAFTQPDLHFFVTDEDNACQVGEMAIYLQQNACSEQARAFSIAVAEAGPGAEVNWEEKIINNLTGKALCVYNKIKQQNGVRKALDRFQNTNSPASLVIENTSLGEAFGNTVPPNENDLITVQLNSDSGFWGVDYQPNLLVAQTIFHEIIHAEFFRQLVAAVGSGNYTQVTIQELYQALINNELYTLYEHIRNHNDWSHNFMANYYRDTIARVTQEFATGVAVPDNNQPLQLYMDLAWKGLRIDGEVQAWDDLTEEQKQVIDNTINSYTNNNGNQICTE